MDAVTYPDEKVTEFLQTRVIPLRVAHNHVPLAQAFAVKWTPTLVTLDQEGREHHRTVGFLGAEELIPSLLLGMGKAYFDAEQFEQAIKVFDELLTKHPKTDSAPEATFVRGVGLYKSSHDPKPLRAAYDKLKAEYPESEWTKRAYPYRLIN
jgi:tetratricopeptide (TPR) repeat protein